MNSTRTKPFNGGRLLSIDALRGLAALGVVLYHAVQQTRNAVPTDFLKWPALIIQFASSFGYIGVFLFFVISGFCIHLQWARAHAAGDSTEIQFRAFWKRRIRRLYPPYLLAFALYLLIAAFTNGINVTRFFVYDIGMHLIMLHNLDARICYSINGVFWTLAVEEQLYLAYFALLFLRLRWGWTVALTVCVVARIGWYLVSLLILGGTGFGIPVAEAAAVHWFTWALGAISVEAFFGTVRLPAWCRNIWLGGALVILGAALALLLPSLHILAIHDFCWLLLHPIWGIGFFVVLNRAVFAEQSWLRHRKPRIVSVLASVGIFSYSLYLTHELVIMQSWRFGAWRRFPMLNTLVVAVPVTIAAAWLFFRYCERPYTKKATPRLPIETHLREDVFPKAIEQAEA